MTDPSDDVDTLDDDPVEETTDPEPDDQDTEAPAGPAYDRADLGEFEGRRVAGVTTQFGGHKIDGGPVLHHGDHVVTVTVSVVDDVRHPRKDGVIVRTQVAKPEDTWVLDDADYAEQLVRSLRLARQRAEDEAAGRQSFGIRTDENGVVLTPGDLADEELPEVPAVGPDELVIVFESGTRALWPDDFDPAAERPMVGDTLDGGLVVELLDPVTGESLAVLDRAAEAAADREVVEDLEAARRRRRAEEIVGMTQGPAMAAIAEVNDGELLDEIGRLETDGKNRAGMRKALDERRAELDVEPF